MYLRLHAHSLAQLPPPPLDAKSTALKTLIKTLKRQGVPIDGVGLQAHLTVGGVPATLQQNLEEFAALGLELAITELDIRFAALPASAAGLAQQAADYATVVRACAAVSHCVGVTLWDFTDKVSVTRSLAVQARVERAGPPPSRRLVGRSFVEPSRAEPRCRVGWGGGRALN